MKFLTESVQETDRHTEPRVCDIPIGYPMPPKYEEITLTVKLIGSGDTRKFSSDEIVSIAMNRLMEIENVHSNDKAY